MHFTPKLVALDVVLTSFLALTGYAVWQHGYLGFFDLAFANAATTLVFVDLSICLGLFLVWMHGDARERGLPFLPYLLVGLTLGSAGPLAYLMHREWRESRERERKPAPAAVTA